ncbi:hypothetical protein [Leifsonia xyli]|uniref:hypothetical protein n=1 Tax=Leifsonia xyli TaxID=1575 RepID=UPI001186C2C8|nr:hypothetical protein [Leifsonia xyli]
MATITRPQWVDELWQASRAVRPFFDKGSPQPLSSLKVQGWKIDLGTLPTIDRVRGSPGGDPLLLDQDGAGVRGRGTPCGRVGLRPGVH